MQCKENHGLIPDIARNRIRERPLADRRRAMPKDTLGDFEQLVLLAALRLGDGAYTVTIIEDIESRTGRAPTHAAVYVAMRRLEDKGLVSSEKGEPTPERGGRAKRFFRVEAEAVELLRQQKEALLSMWEGLEERV